MPPGPGLHTRPGLFLFGELMADATVTIQNPHNPATPALPSPPAKPLTELDGPPPPGRGSPTSVHPLETPRTTEQTPTPDVLLEQHDELCSTFRHGFWHHRRQVTHSALKAASATDRQLEAFRTCGHGAWIHVSDEDRPRYRLSLNRCHNRWCEACAVEHRRVIVRNLREQLPRVPMRLFTFTLKSSARSLGDQLTRAWQCFSAWRKDRRIKPRLLGGLAFFEITLNSATGLWHPHLHVLTHGSYIPQDLARAVWSQVTGDSYIVDVRFCHNPEHAAAYVAKYASKSCGPNVHLDVGRLAECIKAFAGRRLIAAFGDWRSLSLSRTPPDDVGWSALMPLWELLARAAHGDREARFVLATLRRLDSELPVEPIPDTRSPPPLPELPGTTLE